MKQAHQKPLGNDIISREVERFLAVAKWKSIALAAQRMNLTQPALSTSIKKLEQSLGVRLFDRGMTASH